MKQKSYAQMASDIAKAGWGRKVESDEAAAQTLLQGMNLSGACLLAILSKIDSFLDALTAARVREKAEALDQACDEYEQKWMAEREVKHGPCPESVRWWFREHLAARIGSMLRGGTMLSSPFYVDSPAKGSEVRKEYDKWMRRKRNTK